MELLEKNKNFLECLKSTLTNYNSQNNKDINVEPIVSKLNDFVTLFENISKQRTNNENAINDLIKHIENRISKILSNNSLLENKNENIQPENLVKFSKNITKFCQKLIAIYNKKDKEPISECCKNGKVGLDLFYDHIEYYFSQEKSNNKFNKDHQPNINKCSKNISDNLNQVLSSILLSEKSNSDSSNSTSMQVILNFISKKLYLLYIGKFWFSSSYSKSC